MKTLPTLSGPFSERPYFTLDEINRIALDELLATGLYPRVPGPVRVERFIEKRFKVSPTYEELPDGVLGYTRFGARGVQAVVVSRALSEAGSTTADRRLSSTLAHEVGHGLLHSYLFAMGDGCQALFSGNAIEPMKILCRKDGVFRPDQIARYDGRWWEYQANQCMAAILLPRPLVLENLGSLTVSDGMMGIERLPKGNREEAIKQIAAVFEVNPIVARIKIAELFPEGAERQLTL